MDKLYYCVDCRRVFREDMCPYCGSTNIKELTVNAPVNILGTKLKGKVMKICKDEVKVIHVNAETKEKYIKGYSIEKLKKVL